MSPEEARAGIPGGDQELPGGFLNTLKGELQDKYDEMLQHIRMAWAFQDAGQRGWNLMDQGMEKMKQLALFAEAVAEDGAPLVFRPGKIERVPVLGKALEKAGGDVRAALKRHENFRNDEELKKHGGIAVKLDLAVRQEAFQAAEIEDWIKE